MENDFDLSKSKVKLLKIRMFIPKQDICLLAVCFSCFFYQETVDQGRLKAEDTRNHLRIIQAAN